MNYDQSINVTDLLAVISAWGNPYDVTDLLNVIEHWDSACELPGACCLPDGSCEATDAYDCDAAGGLWSGTDTYCSYVDCPQPGACCMDDGSCVLLLPADCVAEEGTTPGRTRHAVRSTVRFHR